MARTVDICDLALSHLGIALRANLVTERSEAARACRAFYATARDQVLRDFPWPFATRTTDLALVTAQPTTEWAYAYRYPAAAVAFRRILTGATRLDSQATRIPFRLARDDDGALVYTDQADAVGEWTERVEDAEQYP